MNESTKLEKYFYLEDVSEKWKSALTTKKKVYIFSPYITSPERLPLAESVLNGIKNKKNCEIYTTFKFENFLSGGSSIETLRKLINKGFKLYAIPKLHAKIVLVSKTFVSIGSQNLTANGTYNKEATVVSTDCEIIDAIETELKETWLSENCKRISLEMLDDVGKHIDLIQEHYDKLNAEIKKSDKFIEEQENKREIKRKNRAKRLKRNLADLSKTNRSVIGKVILKNDDYSHVDGDYVVHKRWTFQIPQKKNLLDSLIIFSGRRYLAVNSNNNKLSWAKVNDKSITFFHNKIEFTEKIQMNEKYYNLTIESNWDFDTFYNFNLKAF